MGVGCAREVCPEAAATGARQACLKGILGSGVSRSPTGTPLPGLLHRRLRREEVCRGPGGRLIIVGDVHGCAEELKRLLEAERFDEGRDTLVLVGDLVNKGPSSGEVIRTARECGALCVRGNHDDELLEAWFRVGRFSACLENYTHDALQQVSLEDIRWLQEQPLTLSLPWLPLLVVHAGLVPGIPLQQQAFKHLLWLRDVRQADHGAFEGLENPRDGSVGWASVWPGPEHVVFGHDAKRKLQLDLFATGLDTGCCYGFFLTALVVDPDDFSQRRIVHVPAKQVYSVPKDRAGGPDQAADPLLSKQ